jgi:hypothetical protein
MTDGKINEGIHFLITINCFNETIVVICLFLDKFTFYDLSPNQKLNGLPLYF